MFAGSSFIVGRSSIPYRCVHVNQINQSQSVVTLTIGVRRTNPSNAESSALTRSTGHLIG